MEDILPNRVLPELDLANTAFWTSGQDGTLRFERCRCGTWIHPSTGRCADCLSTAVTLTPVSGHGTIYSYTINYQQWIPDSEPYAVILVDLAEGTPETPLRLTSNLVGADLEHVHIGMAVEVCFVNQEDVWLPQFKAVAE